MIGCRTTCSRSRLRHPRAAWGVLRCTCRKNGGTATYFSASRRNFARVRDFARVDGTDLICFQRDHRGGAAVQGEEFDLMGAAVVVEVDDCPHVAGAQAFRGDVDCEDDTVMFL